MPICPPFFVTGLHWTFGLSGIVLISEHAFTDWFLMKCDQEKITFDGPIIRNSGYF